jgi:predicted nucleic acid-binding protein
VNILLDTNVLLDVLAQREPFYGDAADIWTLAERGRVTAYVSALSLPNLYYILRKLKGQKPARKTVGILRDIFSIVPLDAQIIHQATDAEITDFEDAIQFFSAVRIGATTLITRNPKDFPRRDVAIQTPAEFLATHFAR